MTRVSNFKLAEFVIKLLCRQYGVGFVDMHVMFGEQSGISNGILQVVETPDWSKTVYQIVSTYLSNLQVITGSTVSPTNEELQAFTNWLLSLVRDFSYSTTSFPEALPNRSTALRLNRDPFVWLVMRDLVSPAFETPIRNVRMVAAKSGKIDGAHLVDSESGEPLILVNMGMENQPARTAHVLFTAIQAHGLDPQQVGQALLDRGELRGPFMGTVKVAMDSRESINTFVTVFSILCDYQDREGLLEQKTAGWNASKGLWSQAQYDPSGWWYLGLIEKLLEPARGADWSGYFTLKPFTDELYGKIEEEKKRRGLPNLSMEALLRVQSEEYKQRGDLTLQGLLADNRVW